MESSWGRPGVVLGGSWGGLGVSWGRLWRSWVGVGTLLGRFGRIFKNRQKPKENQSFLLGLSGPWGRLGGSWEALEALLGGLGGVLGGSWRVLG